jgi:hypothetical protein
MKPGYVLIGGYEVLPPVTSHNAGYLEGAGWMKGVMSKEVEAQLAERRPPNVGSCGFEFRRPLPEP